MGAGPLESTGGKEAGGKQEGIGRESGGKQEEAAMSGRGCYPEAGRSMGTGQRQQRPRAAGTVTAAAGKVMDGGRVRRGTEQVKTCRSGPETQLRPGRWPWGGELPAFQVAERGGLTATHLEGRKASAVIWEPAFLLPDSRRH